MFCINVVIRLHDSSMVRIGIVELFLWVVGCCRPYFGCGSCRDSANSSNFVQYVKKLRINCKKEEFLKKVCYNTIGSGREEFLPVVSAIQ